MKRRLELSAAEVRWTPPENVSGGQDSTRIKPAEGTIGQERAIEALRTGLALRARGFNVFAAGPDGTGRLTTVKAMIDHVRETAHPVPRDRCYVHNFADPDRPRLLVFPRGGGRDFRKQMDDMIAHLRSGLPALLESEEFKRSISAVVERFRQQETTALDGFEKKIKTMNFAFAQMKMGNISVPDLLPLVKGKAVPVEKLDDLVAAGELSAQESEAITKAYEGLHGEFEQVLRRARDIARTMQSKLIELERDACDKIIRGFIGDLTAQQTDDEVKGYLAEVHESLLGHLGLFKPEPTAVPEPFAGMIAPGGPAVDPFIHYRVNVIHDATTRPACPVEIPESATYLSIFGAIEMDIFRSGAMHTDFMRIKPGSLLRADGGFLVLQADEVLRSPGVYQALKRALKTGRIEIELPEGPILTPALALKPEPIEIDVKVVLLGDSRLYDLLFMADEEFAATFKIKAEFDREMPNTPDNRRHYLRVLTKIGKKEGLAPMNPAAVGRMVEHGVRLAGRRAKLSTRFDDVADVYREAAHIATRRGEAVVSASHVRDAVQAVRHRHNLPEEKLQEMIDAGTIRIEIDGERVGQVNGLAVYDLGQYAFGKPSRITATVSIGSVGIVNVERESGLSGKIHDKGMLILTAFLRERYGQRFPLALTATLAFEQSYGPVDGDSASSTELYALLSELSGFGLNQGIAVTGSVDQRGRVQPIGGVNEKIEGFFDVCRGHGLTGRQGVMIPSTNADDLMLREDVVEAIAAKKFHVWAVETIEEGIELLTGKSAKAVDLRVTARLKKMSKAVKK